MQIPIPRGRLTPNRSLSDLTWLRVGGPADYLFQPADPADLAQFLTELPLDVMIFPIGVGSNLIVRDGGIRGVVIRLGRAFNEIFVDGELVQCGAAALDSHVASKAADAGLDLTFLRTIPGAMGGALKMNAGCYGSYFADAFVSARGVNRAGEQVAYSAETLGFGYRTCDLPEGVLITEITLRRLGSDSPEALHQKMSDQLAKRDETQPTKDRTAGSTFRNPAGFSSTGRADDRQDLKAWKVIDDAGCRGLELGGAQMSPKHPNFLINTGTASAKDLEALGELVRKKVYDKSGLTLEWEIMRVGDPKDD
ncbi:MAG: UDP-N-acetylmuramate dehydrogenase [Planktomarina sp.]|jgi:UDP-N-acetylmuramate dehydrogenase|tara:strand:- start:1282 stop:2208 length:927 start_codon:yes stop_codon:yes gene_type:complete